jgi:hypothetical protein
MIMQPALITLNTYAMQLEVMHDVPGQSTGIVDRYKHEKATIPALPTLRNNKIISRSHTRPTPRTKTTRRVIKLAIT